MDPISTILITIVLGLIGIVWRNLDWRLKEHEERMRSYDQTLLYLRDQGHELRNLIPNPAEVEVRRRENSDNFNRIFQMLREIEKKQNEMIGQMKLRGD